MKCPPRSVSIPGDKCEYCPLTFEAVNNECQCPPGQEVNPLTGECDDSGGTAGVCEDPSTGQQYDGSVPDPLDPTRCICLAGWFNENTGQPVCTECVADATNDKDGSKDCTCRDTTETWLPVGCFFACAHCIPPARHHHPRPRLKRTLSNNS